MNGTCWPTADQALLLQAALLEGESARAAFDAWSSRRPDQPLDRASQRLLPALYQRLLIDNPSHALVPQLQEAFESAQSKTRAVAEGAAEAIALLRDAGIETCLLKGMALIARGYMPMGTRTMADGDVLVRPSQVLAARDALAAAGWQLDGRIEPALLNVRHAVPCRHPDGGQIDLHWHVLAECCTPGADNSFWEATEPAGDTRTLCAADMLLHACVHGLSWSVVPTIRWIIDATLIIRGAGDIMNWERLIEQSARHLLTVPMLDALTYLRERMHIPLPEWVEPQLSRIDVPPWTVAEHRAKMRQRSLQRQLLVHWFRHRRLSASGSVLGDLVRVPAYVRLRWRARPTPTHAIQQREN